MKFARKAADAAQHLVRAHHLRDRFRRDEGSDFDGIQPGADQGLDEGDAVGGADRRFFILQAVPWAHLNDTYGVAHGLPHDPTGSTSASSTPSCTMSPTLHLM